MSNPTPKKRIGEPFLAIRHLRWRGSNNIQSMSAASRGVFVELLIEQRIYGCFPKDVRLLSKRTGFTKEILTKWLANHQHLLMECEGNTEYFVSKNYSDLMTGNDLAFQNLQTRLDIDQTREDKTRPDSGQQDGLSPTPDSESSLPATSEARDARPARLKEVLGLPGEINKFCKDFHLLLYPKKDPKSYPPDWLEEFNSLWVGKQTETTLDELLSIAKWGIQESPVQEKTGFSWTAQIVDMKSFCKFVQKGTLQDSGKAVTGWHTLFYYDTESGGTYKYRYEVGDRPHPPYSMGTSQCYLKSWWEQHPYPETGVEDYPFTEVARNCLQLDSCDCGQLVVARAHGDSLFPLKNIFGHQQFPAVERGSLPQQFFDAIT